MALSHIPTIDTYVGIVRRERNRKRAARIVARAFVRQLRRSGFDHAELISVVTEILDCLCEDEEEPVARTAVG